jgi:DNA processing protein
MALSDAERRDWIRLGLSENIGPQTFAKLLKKFGTAAAALEALPELSTKGGLRRPLRIAGKDQVEDTIARADRFGARYVMPGEQGYPEPLRHIDNAPVFLCIKGRSELAERTAIGIVGSRNASAVGRKFTRQIAAELGAAGLVIASGFARGIDTAAHEAALATGTIAVAAGGVDHIYPPENEQLHAAVCEEGLMVSEMIMGSIPKAEHFPRRNRIISGVSRAIIVVEAALRSGSLITARLAGEQGRDVYAVPGSPLDPRCEGTNKLIRQGATLLTSARDILDDFDTGFAPGTARFSEPPSQPPARADVTDSDRGLVVTLLSPTPVAADDLVREAGLSPAAVTEILLELELAGRAIRNAGGLVSLA